jgi:hypothetical protein
VFLCFFVFFLGELSLFRQLVLARKEKFVIPGYGCVGDEVTDNSRSMGEVASFVHGADRAEQGDSLYLREH